MKYNIVSTFPNDFFTQKSPTMISIYQKTSRHLTDNKRDSLVFKNLVKEVETSLLKLYDHNQIKPLMNLLESIENETIFWSHTKVGIALFATLDECVIYHLESSPKTLAVVADSFHLKPLIEYHQYKKTYQILDIDGQSFNILQGDLHHIEHLDLNEDIQTNLEDILKSIGKSKNESYLTHGTYGGSKGNSTFHGHGGKNDEIEIELEQYFRQADSTVFEHVSKVSKLPMILLSPESYHSQFFRISNNTYLIKEAIDGTFDSLGTDKLLAEIDAISKKAFNLKTQQIINRYHELKETDQSSDQLIDIVHKAIKGRVSTLLIEADKIIAGKIDIANMKIIKKELSDPAFDDLLDDLAQLVLEKGGQVMILKESNMPTTSGVAAVYRY